MIQITSRGEYNKLRSFFNTVLSGNLFSDLDRYGQMGVDALERATPVDTGLTASSWKYRIVKEKNSVRIEWYNTHGENGTPIAILIQYGHGTGTGGYVQGRDFINPSIRPIFDKIADDVWKKVKS